MRQGIMKTALSSSVTGRKNVEEWTILHNAINETFSETTEHFHKHWTTCLPSHLVLLPSELIWMLVWSKPDFKLTEKNTGLQAYKKQKVEDFLQMNSTLIFHGQNTSNYKTCWIPKAPKLIKDTFAEVNYINRN